MEDKRSSTKGSPEKELAEVIELPKKPKRARKKPKSKSVEKTSPKSEQDHRLRLISELMFDRDMKGNPRDHVVITQAKQILDVSGVFELRYSLPDPLVEGNHVWVRGHTSSGREVVAAAIVIEDHVEREVEGENDEDKWVQDCVMIRDEPRTREWLVPRVDCSPLPLTANPMLVHKRNLDALIGKGWSEVFWNSKLRRRRAKPKTSIIRKLN
jgi:hypothetical protein